MSEPIPHTDPAQTPDTSAQATEEDGTEQPLVAEAQPPQAADPGPAEEPGETSAPWQPAETDAVQEYVVQELADADVAQTAPATDQVPTPAQDPDEAVQVAAPDASSLPPELDTEDEAPASPPVATPVPSPPPTPAAMPAAPSPAALAKKVPTPTPAQVAGRLHPATPGVRSSEFGRVSDEGTVYVTTPEGEKEVGSYPGATPEEALAYFTRKFIEVDAQADLLLQRVTQTGLSTKEATDGLTKLRENTKELRAVGDLVALAAKVENIATALEARRQVEAGERALAREEAKARRLEIVEAAERIAATPEEKIQWKPSSAQMRQLLDDWKAAQKSGPKLDRETEQALWHRLSGARNGFDKLRRVHFAQLGSAQSAAKAAKEELVEEAERLAQSTEWGPAAGAFKRLMDRWRQSGRAARTDDDALWARFKAAQDSFFAAKDQVMAAENEEYSENLKVKEELLKAAQALLPIKDLESTKVSLRQIQDKWDAAGKVPRADMDRIEKAMRRVEAAVREAEDRKWHRTNPEVAARAQSLVTQLEAACEGLRKDLAKAQASGDAGKIAKATEALEAREAWLAQARTGLQEFSS